MRKWNWPSCERLWRVALERFWCVRAVLRVVSWGYAGVIAVRTWLYDRGWLRIHRVGVPVVSVGNIALGGTGKTPLVELLVHSLSDRRVAVVSRGYGGEAERRGQPLIIRPGMPASLCGDEPACLANNLSDSMVIVSRDRVAGAQLAERLGAEVIVLDDGFQHRRLYRDCDIVLVDGCRNKKLFPRGHLREGMRALARATLVVERKQFCLMPVAVEGEIPMPLDALVNRPVGLFCGIGKGGRFAKTVRALGGVIVEQWCVGDHQEVKEEQLRTFASQCHYLGATNLLCTQKDWIKLPQHPLLALPISYLVVRLEPNEPTWWQEQLSKFLA